MRIITNQKLDICNSINYALGMLKNNCAKFYVDTEFGTVAIETTSKYEILKPVIVFSWDYAPETVWVLYESRHHVSAEYYVSFGYKRFQDDMLTKFQLVLAFCNCLMRHLTNSDIQMNVSDGLVKDYYQMIGERYPGAWDIAHAVMKRDTKKNLSFGIARKDYENYENQLQMIIDKRISEAIEMSGTGIQTKNKIFTGFNEFGNDFYDTAVGLALLYFNKYSTGTMLKRVTYENYKKIIDRDQFDRPALSIIDELFAAPEEE